MPKQSTALENDVFPIDPQVDVWLSKDKLFVWNGENPQPLEQLPARIQIFKAMHPLRFASISGEELTRYNEMVYALSELKKAGFRSVTVETRVKSEPGRQFTPTVSSNSPAVGSYAPPPQSGIRLVDPDK